MDDDEQMTETEIDELFERTQPIGNAINALAQAELAVAAVDELHSVTAERLHRVSLRALAAFEKETSMNDSHAVPDWASESLRRAWPTLTPDDHAALIADHERAELAILAAELRRTDSDESLGTRPGGMFTIDGHDGLKWRAERFEEPWNGWATPVVTRGTVENLFADLRDWGDPGAVRPDGVVVIHQEEDDGDFLLSPDEQGLYHLYELGWVFMECD